MIDMLLIIRSWCTMGVIFPPLVSLIKMTVTQSRHTMVMPMFKPPMMKELAMSGPEILTIMKSMDMMKEVPYMVTVVGMNLTAWPLQMRVGVQRKSPLMVRLNTTAGPLQI